MIGNLNASGFYRVNYDRENWNKIIEQLRQDKNAIPARMRAQLINDAFSLAQANIQDPILPFELIKYMKGERDYLPWHTFIKRVNYLIDMLELSKNYGLFNAYLLDLVKPLYDELTWTESTDGGETWLKRLLRTDIINFACAREHRDCVEKAKSMFKEWTNNELTNK